MMDLPLQLIVLSIPSLIYIAVRRRRGEKWSEVLGKIGWQGSRPIYFLWSLGVTIIIGGLGWLAFQTVPAEVLQDPNINISAYTGWTLSVASFLLGNRSVGLKLRTAEHAENAEGKRNRLRDGGKPKVVHPILFVLGVLYV
jgi:heme/copper-type cytochrome/quinol oxidase subunit 2